MEDLPELSEPTKRKLKIQWDTLLDNHNLTPAQIAEFERRRNSLLEKVTLRATPGRQQARQAANILGLDPSVKVAEGRFRGLASEYWSLWCSSGTGYETFSHWIAILKGDISVDLESLWKGRSVATDRWFCDVCLPAIRKALTVLARPRIAQARDVEMRRLRGARSLRGTESGNTILDEIYKVAGGDDPQGIQRLLGTGGEGLSPTAKKAIQMVRATLARRELVSSTPSAIRIDMSAKEDAKLEMKPTTPQDRTRIPAGQDPRGAESEKTTERLTEGQSISEQIGSPPQPSLGEFARIDKVPGPSPKDLVDAAKLQPRRSYEKFAAHMGIGKDTLYAITKETRWVTDEMYRLVAKVCACKPEELHPRDIPRPKRHRH